ncbi:hypothetical protein [Rhizobium sp. BR 315]|uniref:hypothetical protein n=1 Tax=Rhizobium sp. BR 315 TaxID=3040014 RepID=UPI003D34E24A
MAVFLANNGRSKLASDRSSAPSEDKENEQPLAKIQRSEVHKANKSQEPDGKGALVADPRNRLVNGKLDPATKELKPKRK